jgi:hypothetical protein
MYCFVKKYGLGYVHFGRFFSQNSTGHTVHGSPFLRLNFIHAKAAHNEPNTFGRLRNDHVLCQGKSQGKQIISFFGRACTRFKSFRLNIRDVLY